MKKLLILAYDFPPYVSVGGLRPYSWYKHLKEFGVYPIVVTRQWANDYGDERDYIAPSKSKETLIEETEFGTIVKASYKANLSNRLLLKYGTKRFKLFRKLISGFFEFGQYFFNIGPKSCVYRVAKNYLKTNSVDMIIATADPFVLFKYASALSRQYNLPWIADYRDPWVEAKGSIQKFNRFFERRYLKNATQITTVSEFLIQKIKQNVQNKPFDILINGYDSSLTEHVSSIYQTSKVISFAFIIPILASIFLSFNDKVASLFLSSHRF